jgi:hydroxymethylbilane synthase
MDKSLIKIGTRASRLARWQADEVRTVLERAGYPTEIVLIQTIGDQLLETTISKIGEKGVFTRALDEALEQGKIDVAVHSAKDIPTEFSDELEIVAVMKREDPRDVLLANSEEVHFENFSKTFRIGTSSLRRQAFLRNYFPMHEVAELRGNLDTRLEKLKRGDYDGIILAYAGVARAGFKSYIRQKFSVSQFSPAVAQGAVAVMARKEHPIRADLRNLLNDITAEIEITAERAFLNRMNGGCHAPIFGLATLTADTLTLSGGIAAMDGSGVIRQEVEGQSNQAVNLGVALANSVLSSGGKDYLNGIES